jgi:hypothetical protein
VDALVFSLRDRRFRRATKSSRLLENLEKNWGLIVERGGSDLSFLVPRRYFLLKRDLFRMEGGKRKGDHHFCPTSPDTIKLLQSRAAALLDQPGFRHGGIYHLWPDRGAEHLWCACPACRAFSPREQIRLAVNTVAVVIAEKDPQAFVSCREQETKADEQLPGGSELSLRSNVFTLQTGTPPDGGGLLLYTYERGVIGEL